MKAAPGGAAFSQALDFYVCGAHVPAETRVVPTYSLVNAAGMRTMRAKTRTKDGKEHRYWSVVENRRFAGGRVVQRHVLYLGEIKNSNASRRICSSPSSRTA
jgi:hypothetical protein